MSCERIVKNLLHVKIGEERSPYEKKIFLMRKHKTIQRKRNGLDLRISIV